MRPNIFSKERFRNIIKQIFPLFTFLFLPGGPSYDAEVNRLREEVNSLRETLAMQSSYMENMPKFSTGTSTDRHILQVSSLYSMV